MSDLKTRILAGNPDVVAICETWTQEDPLDPRFYPSECANIPGYNLYRYDNSGTLKGGIIIYVKPVLDGGICKKINTLASTFEESAWHWLNIKTKKDHHDKLLFGCIYRKGSSTFENNQNLNMAIKEACKLNDLVTVCGDFNFPSIDWKIPLAHSETPTTEDTFLETLNDLCLIQHVCDFTRKRGLDEPSLLDLVITDTHQITNRPKIMEPFGLSDHGLVTWSSTFKVCEETVDKGPPKHNFYKGNYRLMKRDLQNVCWETYFSDCKDVNEMTEKFNNKITEMIKAHVPLKTNKNNVNHAPWVDFKTLKAVRKKYHSWKRFQATKSHERYLDYIKYRNKATKKLRKAKKEFEKKIAMECTKNPKAFYSYANNYKKASTNFIRLKNKDGTFTMNDTDTADVMNTYFQSDLNSGGQT